MGHSAAHADTDAVTALRVYIKPADYGELQPVLIEYIKLEFDRQKLTFAVPQRELRRHETTQANRELNAAT